MSIADRYWSSYYANRDRNDNIKIKVDIKEVRSGNITITKNNKSSSFQDKLNSLFKRG